VRRQQGERKGHEIPINKTQRLGRRGERKNLSISSLAQKGREGGKHALHVKSVVDWEKGGEDGGVEKRENHYPPPIHTSRSTV